MSPPVREQPETQPAPARVAFACAHCGRNLKVRTEFAGKRVKCPKCGKSVPVPPLEPEPILVLVEEEPTAEPEAEPILEVVEEEPAPPPSAPRRFSILGMLFLVLVVLGCSIYANLSFLVKNRVNYQYFPPFKKYYNGNDNKHLGAEYFNIAKS